ncbi:MAG TPA: hypothetical protein ENK64_03870, partial [Flavobacteriales bacterium]|nr:hypothetical protein [Flavobacteriales bacterium]
MKHYIYTFIFLWSFTGFAQSTQNFDKQKNDDLLKDFEKTEALKHAHYGISIRQLSNGKEIVNVNAKHSFAPASNLKLLYTLTAVEQLGKDYRYKTTLTYSGKIVNKILFGDLIIQASGDPSFGSIRMGEDYQALIEQMMSRLRNLGIQKISGQLIMEVNGWRYPAAGSWPIEDIGNYYGTGAWGFNFNDNRLDIFLKRGSHVGEPTNVIKTEPDVSGIKYISKVVTAAPDTDDQAYVYAAPVDTERYILGTIPAGNSPFKIKGGMPNPPLSFLKIFKQNLADNHISIDGIQVRNALKKHKEILWQYQSKPMIELA